MKTILVVLGLQLTLVSNPAYSTTALMDLSRSLQSQQALKLYTCEYTMYNNDNKYIRDEVKLYAAKAVDAVSIVSSMEFYISEQGHLFYNSKRVEELSCSDGENSASFEDMKKYRCEITKVSDGKTSVEYEYVATTDASAALTSMADWHIEARDVNGLYSSNFGALAGSISELSCSSVDNQETKSIEDLTPYSCVSTIIKNGKKELTPEVVLFTSSSDYAKAVEMMEWSSGINEDGVVQIYQGELEKTECTSLLTDTMDDPIQSSTNSRSQLKDTSSVNSSFFDFGSTRVQQK